MATSFNQEDLTALTEALKPMVVEAASKAAADHVTKRNKSFEEKFETTLEQFKSVLTPKQEEEIPEKNTLSMRVSKTEEDNKKLREELRQEKEANQRKNMKSSLESTLLKAGIPAAHVKAVSAQLIHEDKLVDLDREGQPIFKVAGYNNETMPLNDGISEWLKNDGKSFIPPPIAKGAGIKTIKSNNVFLEPDSSPDEIDSALWTAVQRATQ